MNNGSMRELTGRDSKRLANYRAYLDFYNGDQWPERSKHRQLVFNYAKVAIDKVTSYLMQGFNMQCHPRGEGDEQKDRARRAEAVLYQVYDRNHLAQLDYETEVDAAILGDGCYKVLWDAKEERVKVTAPAVEGINAWWCGDDTSRVWKVASEYQLTAEEVQLVHGVKIASKSAKVTEVWTDDSFELYIAGGLKTRAKNPYGFIPFVIFPNLRQPKEFWGVSDIPALMQPQRELNRALTQLSRILEVSGNPIAVLEGVERSEDIAVQPGAVWTLPPDAKAYLLDLLQGGGIRLHVDYIELVYRCLHDLSEAPRAAYGGIERELSGVALEVELQSLLQKVQRKRLIRGSAYARRARMILELHRLYNGEDLTDVDIAIGWGSIIPQDRARQAQNEHLLVMSGIHSRRTAMDELGVRDSETEFSRWLEERREIMRMNQELKASPGRGEGERRPPRDAFRTNKEEGEN